MTEVASGSTDTHPDAATPTALGPALTQRGLRLVLDKTTDMAARTLRVPLNYYGDDKLTELEYSTLLRRTPLAVLASAQIPNPNDYVVRSMLDDSLLITRDRSGKAHVLLNYCRHRGAMPACGSGNARRFTCPYHAWVYDNTGKLRGLPGKAGFDDIDRADYGLVELPSEERHGFIWAVLTADAALDLDAHLGSFGDELAQWNYETYQYHDERFLESTVSWKGALEAFAEGYHFPFVHGDSVIGQNTVANTHVYDEFGDHHRIGFPFNWITELKGKDPSDDWDPIQYMGVIYWIFPNLILANSPVGVEVLEIFPGKSATDCRLRHSWMARFAATTPEQSELYDGIFAQVHAAVRDEDFAMLPQCGEGVRRAQHDHMLIGRNEIGVQHMVEVLAGRLGVALG
ncbi:aromatic ring-hydroxylating dioxygenase subunit alpha [Mycolicibacillus parakoreensis]|uniref:Aromatic ring-hydroxylating dioxygenase subunit alpha n=1 Tax=Mycolicibacillus parakoreensis TaxID=1069221 RepID=A0ABY3TYW5_9MYCO|nr:aromatic ring-hydroxylating dioxygenase subunit alpha [Mycolicibacillus parakoreensis]MCV7314160.1 aromatic ring-hydroxylating dioxygenase subunit alpha [Mycolicibacillus parakoreensis]ULN52880.1 aromatic ring-hydroxylating dioxygenase subunit alpha [Mycolicibacillus parakoreensis]